MKVISVTCNKGGVGKSTFAVHLAAGLATRGYRVGLVDTANEGHAGLMLQMPDENGLFRLLIERAPLGEVINEVPAEHYSLPDYPSSGTLYLLSGGDRTYKIPQELEPQDMLLFYEQMEALAAGYQLDVIFVDTNPNKTLFDGALYLATDRFIYITECERLSFDGVQRAIAQMERATAQRQRYLGRDTAVLGILPNKMRADTRLHRHNITRLVDAYGELVWPPVTQRVIWAEATNNLELVYTYAPSGQEARDAWSVVMRTEKALWAVVKS